MKIHLELGTVDLRYGVLATGDGERRLRPLEIRLLAYFSENPKRTLSAGELLREVWGYAEGVETRTLYATVNRLRNTLERDPKHPTHILTVPRAGYRFVPLVETVEPASTLPRRNDVFVGREEVLTKLEALLTRHRMVTLRGPAGVGKSRLALALAERCVEGEELVLWRTVSPGTSFNQWLPGAFEGLVVLDDVDLSLPEIVDALREIRSRSGRVLVTCRTPLGMEGEVLFNLGPLDVPTAGRPELESSGHLLESRVRERIPDFILSPEQPWVGPLLRALGGIPLAIELAAPWFAVLSGPELLEHVEGSVTALRRPGGRGAGEKNDSLHQSLLWSWPLLEGWERDLLLQCTVFQGAFDLRTVRAVLVFPEGSPPVLEAILGLVERSWIRVEIWGGGQSFRLYAGQREFLLQQSNRPILSALVERHTAWFVNLGRSEDVELRFLIGGVEWNRLRLMVEDARSAFERASPTDKVTIGVLLSGLLLAVGPLDACLDCAEGALACAPPGRERVSLLRCQGAALRQLGRVDEAREVASQALVEVEQLENAGLEEGRVLRLLGVVESYHGAREEARSHFAAALEAYRGKGAELDEAVVFAELATLDFLDGDLACACSRVERALASLRDLGTPWVYGIYVGNLGAIELVADDLDSAARHLYEALDLHRRSGTTRYEALALGNLALVEERRGNYRDAHECIDTALSLARFAGDRGEEGNLWSTRGLVLLAEGKLVAAAEALDRSGGLATRLSLPRLQAEVGVRRARVHIALGEWERAEQLLNRAEGLACEQQLGTEQMDVGLARVELWVARSDGPRALEALEAVKKMADGRPILDLDLWEQRVNALGKQPPAKETSSPLDGNVEPG